MADDFYALLEVPRDADQDQIKTAFREKVREYHPDHNDDPRANAQFTAVKKAYDTLGDPVERNAYDRMGHIDYVAKRLSGLPDPEKWAPDAGADSSSGSSSTSSTATGSTTSSSSSRTSTSTGSTGRSGTATSSASTTGTSTGSTSGSTRSETGSASTGSPNASASSRSQQTASNGAGATASARSVAYADDPIVDFVARHNWARRAVGWPLLYFVMLVYAVGLGAVIGANADAFTALVDRLGAAGTDTAALADALERQGVPIFYEATIGTLVGGSTPEPTVLAGSILVGLGAILLPTVVFLLVYLTRLSPGWKPTYLYPLAVLGPGVGLAAGAAAEIPLTAELALVGLLPFGAFFVMLLSAFVRPKLKALLFA